MNNAFGSGILLREYNWPVAEIGNITEFEEVALSREDAPSAVGLLD